MATTKFYTYNGATTSFDTYAEAVSDRNLVLEHGPGEIEEYEREDGEPADKTDWELLTIHGLEGRIRPF